MENFQKVHWAFLIHQLLLISLKELWFLTLQILLNQIRKIKNILDNHSKDDLLSLKGEIQSIHGW